MPFKEQLQADLTNEENPPREAWRAEVESLQKTVCFLLLKNQTMRMALAERGNSCVEDFF